jgi:hypothetical protein
MSDLKHLSEEELRALKADLIARRVHWREIVPITTEIFIRFEMPEARRRGLRPDPKPAKPNDD